MSLFFLYHFSCYAQGLENSQIGANYAVQNGYYGTPYTGQTGNVRNDFSFSENRLESNTYTSPINNYMTTPPSYVSGNVSSYGNYVAAENPIQFNPQTTIDGGYLAMGSSHRFQRSNAKTLNPRYPSYDHWSSISDEPWTLQLLPDGLIFPSYLAGMKEPRLATMWVHDKNFKWVWDASLGGRAGLMRFGTPNSVLPEGVQLDIEGAVLLRMDIEHERDMMANDFRAGVPLTFGGKRWQFKFGYYHLSSHMGDEHTLRTGEPRINYVRDSLVFAVARRFWDDWRVYGEAAWAFFTGEQTRPWEFQVGIEYAPVSPARGFRGTPFMAANLHVFQEKDYSGYFCCQVGWQWRGKNNQLLRFGLQYLNGYDDQFEFHNQTTDKLGLGIWYDF